MQLPDKSEQARSLMFSQYFSKHRQQNGANVFQGLPAQRSEDWGIQQFLLSDSGDLLLSHTVIFPMRPMPGKHQETGETQVQRKGRNLPGDWPCFWMQWWGLGWFWFGGVACGLEGKPTQAKMREQMPVGLLQFTKPWMFFYVLDLKEDPSDLFFSSPWETYTYLWWFWSIVL